MFLPDVTGGDVAEHQVHPVLETDELSRSLDHLAGSFLAPVVECLLAGRTDPLLRNSMGSGCAVAQATISSHHVLLDQ